MSQRAAASLTDISSIGGSSIQSIRSVCVYYIRLSVVCQTNGSKQSAIKIRLYPANGRQRPVENPDRIRFSQANQFGKAVIANPRR